MSDKSARPRFFTSPAEFRAWLQKNHAKGRELLVGFHKRHTSKPTMTWPESVAEALCFGWIDGVRKRIDEDRYSIRFTPRRPGSIWSAVNIRMVARLEAEGKMTDAGRAAFARRTAAKSRVYQYEQKSMKSARLDAVRVLRFKQVKSAWKFFQAQPPGYQTKASRWVTSAKTEETKDRRLQRLMDACLAEQRLI